MAYSYRETGLLCFAEEVDNKLIRKVVRSFERTPGAEYSLYNGKDFQKKFPYLNMKESVPSCYDPTGGVMLADKCLNAVRV